MLNIPNSFKVAEIFTSIQGEGINTGVLCLFIRFSGCNMNCQFCDTLHEVIRYEVTLHGLLNLIVEKNVTKTKHIVLTGGEPLLQPFIEHLIATLVEQNYKVHLETNGTIELNWRTRSICYSISMSPKVPFSKIKIKECTNLKIIFPYLDSIHPRDYENFYAKRKYIQPLCPPVYFVGSGYRDSILEAKAELINLSSEWGLSIQLHKLLDLQ